MSKFQVGNQDFWHLMPLEPPETSIFVWFHNSHFVSMDLKVYWNTLVTESNIEETVFSFMLKEHAKQLQISILNINPQKHLIPFSKIKSWNISTMKDLIQTFFSWTLTTLLDQFQPTLSIPNFAGTLFIYSVKSHIHRFMVLWVDILTSFVAISLWEMVWFHYLKWWTERINSSLNLKIKIGKDF